MVPHVRLLSLGALLLLTPPKAPDVLPVEDFGGEGGIKATVAGKAALLAFKTDWPTSYLLGGAGAPSAIEVLGKTRAVVNLAPVKKDELPNGSEGALGADALRQMAFFYHPYEDKVEILDGPKVGLAGAEKLFAALPAWGAPVKVVRLALVRAKDGSPTLKAIVGGKETLLVPSLSTYNTALDKTVPQEGKADSHDQWSYAPRVAVGGLPPFWLPYSPDDDWDPSDTGAHGLLALDAFASRRVLVDLADDAIYVESLPLEARQSLFLSREIGAYVLVKGKELRMGFTPGDEPDDADEYPEARILLIDKVPGAEWLKDLDDATPQAAARLAKRIAALDRGYDIVVQNDDGEEETIPIPARDDPSRSGLGGSLRAGARALAAWRSRSGRSASAR